ncbi:MAG: glycosyltransferase involved in cell wall biosynthesis [Glaciecola sp.]|jgi:glycosyltransferase involved in cell wall biosynthesis
MSNAKKLQVLIIAEAANPDWYSVPLLGWSHSLALSKLCHTHLVTQIRNLESIERFGWKDGREFTCVNTEKFARPIHKLSMLLRGGNKLGWTIDTALASLIYPYFERQIWKKFQKELTDGKFDIVHRITPVSPTAPSFLAKKLKKINVPFVVGPLNGGVPWPKEFPDMAKKENEWLTKIREIYKLLPGYRSLRKNSSAIICGSKATLKQMPTNLKHKLIYQPENAIDVERFSLKNSICSENHLKVAFVGRLVPYKGCDMAIEAIAELARAEKVTFDIYGTGPEEKKLEALIKTLGLEKFITLHGFIPNTKLQQMLVNADIFLFPSVREFGGGSIIEAMALGLVPIVLDYAGPGELVDDLCGYLIPMERRTKVIQSIEVILKQIINDKSVLKKKRTQAIAKVESMYTWQRKAEQDIEIYKWLLNQRAKPEFFAETLTG